MKSTILISILSVGALFVGGASAQPPEGGRHGPPPEAFTACDAQDEGSLCEFESPRGSVEGTCRVPRGERLVCVPNDRRPPPPGAECPRED